jgi:hypothetical protein
MFTLNRTCVSNSDRKRIEPQRRRRRRKHRRKGLLNERNNSKTTTENPFQRNILVALLLDLASLVDFAYCLTKTMGWSPPKRPRFTAATTTAGTERLHDGAASGVEKKAAAAGDPCSGTLGGNRRWKHGSRFSFDACGMASSGGRSV